MIATQTELARRLGLSRSTVAAALNPNSPVKLRETTRQLVIREAEKLNYRPNPHARLMRGGRSATIGIFHFGGLSQVAAERAWHVSRAIRAAGYRILSTDLSWTPGGARTGCEAMLDERVEGVIVAGLNDAASLKELGELRRRGIPMVTLSGNELKGVPHIRGDASQAMGLLTRHLIGHGRRRLLLLSHYSSEIRSGTYLWAFPERLRGFRRALLAAAGKIVGKFSSRKSTRIEGRVVPASPSADPFDPFRDGARLMRQILAEPAWPDAVLCGNDEWAVGAMSACGEAGLTIPDRMAFTGYDDNALGRYLDVPLTTIAQPNQAMAELAVEYLFEMIRHPRSARVPALTKLPCELVIRKSCGTHPAPVIQAGEGET